MRPRKIRILLAAVLALVVVITLYSRYIKATRMVPIKTSFERKGHNLDLKNTRGKHSMRARLYYHSRRLPFAWMEELTPIQG